MLESMSFVSLCRSVVSSIELLLALEDLLMRPSCAISLALETARPLAFTSLSHTLRRGPPLFLIAPVALFLSAKLRGSRVREKVVFSLLGTSFLGLPSMKMILARESFVFSFSITDLKLVLMRSWVCMISLYVILSVLRCVSSTVLMSKNWSISMALLRSSTSLKLSNILSITANFSSMKGLSDLKKASFPLPVLPKRMPLLRFWRTLAMRVKFLLCILPTFMPVTLFPSGVTTMGVTKRRKKKPPMIAAFCRFVAFGHLDSQSWLSSRVRYLTPYRMLSHPPSRADKIRITKDLISSNLLRCVSCTSVLAAATSSDTVRSRGDLDPVSCS
mmetsp:Transcript_5945/g.11258  ORF Transcript_5945/g.11258 Transcript_5945/m.11258 type:complete len:331 (-) Transcript_5945:1906-2898(-)